MFNFQTCSIKIRYSFINPTNIYIFIIYIIYNNTENLLCFPNSIKNNSLLGITDHITCPFLNHPHKPFSKYNKKAKWLLIIVSCHLPSISYPRPFHRFIEPNLENMFLAFDVPFPFGSQESSGCSRPGSLRHTVTCTPTNSSVYCVVLVERFDSNNLCPKKKLLTVRNLKANSWLTSLLFRGYYNQMEHMSRGQ